MSGTYDKGSLVLDEVVPVADLEVGDVITYMPPTGDHLITHRIAWIGRGAGGARIFRTKGDANPVADPWTFKLDRPDAGARADRRPVRGLRADGARRIARCACSSSPSPRC